MNAANPGTLDGTIRGLNWNKTTMTDNRRLTYTNAIDEATAWYDPVSGKKGDTTGAFISISGPAAGTGASGVVTVPDDEALHLDEFTAEFFFCKDPDGNFASQVLPIQLYNSDGNTFAWQVRFDKDYNSMNLTVSKNDGTTIGKTLAVSQNFSNGWHHVALVYTGSQLKLYYDYQLLGARNWTVAYAENPADAILAIGNSPRSTWGRYHGFIDEFRISDEALTPEQFLRPQPLLCDDDTLVYISGKHADAIDFSGYGTANNLNEVWNGIAAVQTKVQKESTSGRLPTSEAVAPGDAVRTGLYATNFVADTASLFFETNVAAATPGQTARIAIADVVDGQHTLLTNDELTIEFFMKPSPQAEDCKGNKYLIGCHTGLGGQYCSIREAKTYNGHFVMSMRGEERLEQHISSTSARDGNWHHVAVVQDRIRKEACFYVDHKLEHVWTNFVMDASAYTKSSYFKEFDFCAAYNNSQATSYRGFMDEIRITRRALQPAEFLTTNDETPEIPKVDGKQVLFYAPLDGDLLAYPFTNELVGTAEGTNAFDAANVPLKEIAARTAMDLGTTNEAAFVAEDGRITYDNTITLAGAQSMTIEFYANVPEGRSNLPLVRYEDESKCYFQVARSPSGQLEVMVVTDKWTGTGRYVYFDTAKLKSRRWHHYAVTLEKKTVEGEVVTEVRAWVDHEELGLAAGETSRSFDGEIPARVVNAKLYLGRARTWAELKGAIDDVRITEGILGVENFLDACPKTGVIIMIR